MLHPDIHYLPAIATLGSDRLLARAVDQQNDIGQRQNDDSKQLAQSVQDYTHCTGTLIRDNDAGYMTVEWLDAKGLINAPYCLLKLVNEFLVWRGDSFEVSTDKLKTWLALCSMIDPVWIIATAYQQHIDYGILSADIACQLMQNQCAMALPKNRHDAIADNHVHLGGHGSANLSLLNFVYHLSEFTPPSADKWPRRTEYYQFESGCRDKQCIPKMMSLLAGHLGAKIWKYDTENTKALPFCWENLNTRAINDTLITHIKLRESCSPAQQLMQVSVKSSIRSENRWLLFATSLLLAEQKKCIDRRGLMAFIQASTILRNYMIVAGVGLTQFVRYFGFNGRRTSNHSGKKNLNYTKSALVSDIAPGIYREFRISPDKIVDEIKQGKFVLKTVELAELADSLSNREYSANVHFVVHFTRGCGKEDQQSNRYQHKRQELHAQVRKLQEFYSSVTFADVRNHTDPTNANGQSSYDLRKLVRGYDVAGDENELPVEIFAPALRVLRGSVHQTSDLFSSRFPQPFITVHAGEDFSHLLSGLRAIDEAVEFCELRNGDRLGHALALGLDVEQWASRQQRVYLKAGEHLDNLVWAYHQGLELVSQVTELHGVLPLMLDKIQRWCTFIYGEDYSANALYRAWHLRRNCPESDPVLDSLSGPEGRLWMPDRQWLEDHPESSRAKTLWGLYLRPYPADSKASKTVTLTCAPHEQSASLSTEQVLRDSISPLELKLWQAIQDLLMERYNQWGIAIEACPTSNLYIGRFHHYREHPIFRWAPPNDQWLQPGERCNRFGLRRGAITVCLNTDDAGLMPTTIANEHHIIETTARENFHIGGRDAALWIDQIRQDGVKIFSRNHLSWQGE